MKGTMPSIAASEICWCCLHLFGGAEQWPGDQGGGGDEAKSVFLVEVLRRRAPDADTSASDLPS